MADYSDFAKSFVGGAPTPISGKKSSPDASIPPTEVGSDTFTSPPVSLGGGKPTSPYAALDAKVEMMRKDLENPKNKTSDKYQAFEDMLRSRDAARENKENLNRENREKWVTDKQARRSSEGFFGTLADIHEAFDSAISANAVSKGLAYELLKAYGLEGKYPLEAGSSFMGQRRFSKDAPTLAEVYPIIRAQGMKTGAVSGFDKGLLGLLNHAGGWLETRKVPILGGELGEAVFKQVDMLTNPIDVALYAFIAAGAGSILALKPVVGLVSKLNNFIGSIGQFIVKDSPVWREVEKNILPTLRKAADFLNKKYYVPGEVAPPAPMSMGKDVDIIHRVKGTVSPGRRITVDPNVGNAKIPKKGLPKEIFETRMEPTGKFKGKTKEPIMKKVRVKVETPEKGGVDSFEIKTMTPEEAGRYRAMKNAEKRDYNRREREAIDATRKQKYESSLKSAEQKKVEMELENLVKADEDAMAAAKEAVSPKITKEVRGTKPLSKQKAMGQEVKEIGQRRSAIRALEGEYPRLKSARRTGATGEAPSPFTRVEEESPLTQLRGRKTLSNVAGRKKWGEAKAKGKKDAAEKASSAKEAKSETVGGKKMPFDKIFKSRTTPVNQGVTIKRGTPLNNLKTPTVKPVPISEFYKQLQPESKNKFTQFINGKLTDDEVNSFIEALPDDAQDKFISAIQEWITNHKKVGVK